MKLRIKQHPKGFVVEVQKRRFGWWYWTHFVSVMGMNDRPWFFSSYNAAEEDMLLKIKWDTITESRGYVDFFAKVEPEN